MHLMEQKTKEGGASNDDVGQTETGINEKVRARSDRGICLKAMKNEEVDRKRHSQNMQVMKVMHTEMKRTNTIIEEVVDQQNDLEKTEDYIYGTSFCA